MAVGGREREGWDWSVELLHAPCSSLGAPAKVCRAPTVVCADFSTLTAHSFLPPGLAPALPGLPAWQVGCCLQSAACSHYFVIPASAVLSLSPFIFFQCQKGEEVKC